MIRNYFKIALRNLGKNKTFSFINIFGLALGLACCLLIASFVYSELSYDKYPEKASQIYRVELNVTGNGTVETYTNVDIAVGAGMKNAYPEIQAFTRLFNLRESFVKYNNKEFKEANLAIVDSNFLQIFSIPFIAGDAKTALTEPNSIVITKAFAKKYFGDDEPLGKQLILGISTFKVTGLIDKIPDHSHFHKDAFISMSTMHFSSQTWSNVSFFTYLVLDKNADPKNLEAKFPELVKKYVVPEVAHDMGISMAEAQKSVNTFRFFLEPLTRIHLYSNTKYELEANGDIQYVYIFSALAIFILLLACVNFTNLSTAVSAKRAREVGIRKVIGSEKKQLMIQFLVESVLLTYIAIVFTYAIVFALIPQFNQLAGTHLNFGFFFSIPFIISVLVLGLIVGILSGIYPAFFLSSFNIISVLKGSSSTSTNHKSPLRSGLVIFQFAVSTILIISTVVVYQQLHFMQNKKLGYNKEQVLYLQDANILGSKDVQNSFKQELLNDSRILNVSVGTDVPGNFDMDGTQIYPKEKSGNENGAEIHANIYHIDYDYLSTLGIQVLKGRNFSNEFPTDSFAVIINQAAVNNLGWANTDPIGKTIVTSGQHEFKVIGVTADFHYASVKQKIAPLMMELGNHYRTGFIIKIKTTDVKNLLADIKQKWDKANAVAPFSYYFLDEHFASLYAAEQRTGQIFSAFAIVAILIACLGLFGLATFITQQRVKEIGIRKIFGASVPDLILLVSREFLKLVIIAFLLAIPLAWWAMHNWLQDYQYRIALSWWMFLVAGLSVMIIAMLTVSFQSVKAAFANPVKSLRTE